MSICLPVLDQDHRVDRYQVAFRLFAGCRGRSKAVLVCQSAALIRLQRGKSEITALIVIDYEIDRGVAEITYPVEQNYRAHI